MKAVKLLSLLFTLQIPQIATSFSNPPSFHTRKPQELHVISSPPTGDGCNEIVEGIGENDRFFQEFEASLSNIKSGSDIRGQFLDHPDDASATRLGEMLSTSRKSSEPPPLTPLAAYVLGYSFANTVAAKMGGGGEDDVATICIGRDPRSHGGRLVDFLGRGMRKAGNVKVVETGIATTPSLFEFCRSDLCDGGVMVTASHLPKDRNGLKFFTQDGGFTKEDITKLVDGAVRCARDISDEGVDFGVGAAESVDFMPHYANSLRDALIREVGLPENAPLPLTGLRIVLNSGNGSGGFFHKVLSDLGADVESSIGIPHDSNFPNGVPNPETDQMVSHTTQICQECNADLGIMLDTDADRAGFILPKMVRSDGQSGDYQPLNRNRLIALLSVIFSTASPGCTIVTDSCTSEGLSQFIRKDLKLNHFRFVKGYANVIGKAQELNEKGINAEMAIETSGHCAMKENGYLDDGTYTSVKVIGLLARVLRDRQEKESNTASDNRVEYHDTLLDLIKDMDEMEVSCELRMSPKDGTMETTIDLFDRCAQMIERMCEEMGSLGWIVDTENLEGLRVRTGGGGYFMLRRSLHDPILCLGVEGNNADEIKLAVILPLLNSFRGDDFIGSELDLTTMDGYGA